MTLKLNEQMLLYHLASGATDFATARKRFYRDDLSDPMKELFDTLIAIDSRGERITPSAFIEELRESESLEAFGGEQAVLDLIAVAQSMDFEEEVLLLKERVATGRIAQLASSSDNPREAIQLIRAELSKIPEAAPKKIQLQWLSEMPIDYLEVDPPPKPRLMYLVEKSGKKVTFLHKEIVAMIVAAGGTGKTHLLSHLALCLATGIPFLGKFEFDTPGHVCFIVGENNDGDIHRLFRKTKRSLEQMLKDNHHRADHEKFCLFNPNPFKGAAKRIIPLSVHGKNATFIDSEGNPTEFLKNLQRQLIEKEPENGLDLIIFDPITRFAGLDAETDNALATAFISIAESLSSSLRGKPTILLSHHMSKGAASSNGSSTQSAARGSSAFTDGVRWQANLDRGDRDEEMPNEITIFTVTKSNFTAVPSKIQIKKDKEGCPQFDRFV